MQNIVSNNLDPAINKIQHLIQGWDNLHLSLWGRVQAIKMVVIPKLNYLFSMLPLKFPLGTFKTIDKIITQFLWAGKKPRMNLKRLQKKIEYGGLNLPKVQTYQDSFTFSQIVSILGDKTKRPSWVDLEAEICSPFDPMDYLSQCPTIYRNPMINHTIGIWQQLHKNKGLSPYTTEISSLWYDRGKTLLLERVVFSRNKTH